MFNFSNFRKTFFKITLFLVFTALIACNNDSNNNDAYITVSIAGSSQTKTSFNVPAYAQDNTNVNVLPVGITRVDFTITDSNDVVTTKSLPVGPQTQTIRLGVKPNRNLVIEIEALTGNTVSFRGQSNVSALRPGQSFPLSVNLNNVGTPPPTGTVTLSIRATGNAKFEGDSGMSDLTFNVSLSSLANGNVTVDYSANGLTAIGEIDFGPTVGTLMIPAGKLSANINVPIIGETLEEDDESFTLSLSNVSANATLGNAVATGIIISDDFPGRLNDTGAVLCGDYSLSLTDQNSNTTSNNSIICSSSGTSQTELGFDQDDDVVPAGQDALYGRDASENDDSDGIAGFIFTKLDADGSPLSNQTLSYSTQPWTCVKDNYTGLIWEVKTNDGLQNRTSQYTWLNTTGVNDGGSPGSVGNTTSCVSNTGCNTEAYVIDMNAITSCGANNWRMPTVTELLSIVNYNGAFPSIDINFFPNTFRNLRYWTSSSQAINNPAVWTVNFSSGIVEPQRKQSARGLIRLVRDEFIPQ